MGVDTRRCSVRENLFIPSGVDAQAIILKKQLKWFKAHVDPSFDPDAYTASTGSINSSFSRTSSASSNSSNSSRPSSSTPPPSFPSSSSSSSAAASSSSGPRSGLAYQLSIVVAYMQLLGHLVMFGLGFFVVLPFLAPFHPNVAFQLLLLLSLVQQTVTLFRAHGLPRWSADYGRALLFDEESHYFLFDLILLFSSPFLFALVPILVRSLLFICRALQQIGPMWVPSLYSRHSSAVDQFVLRSGDVAVFCSTIEIYSGLLLLGMLITPARNFLLLFFFWNYLKMRYLASASSRVAFGAVRARFDQALLGPGTYCPRVIAAVYQRVVQFMEGQVDPQQPQAQSGRCVVM